MQHSSTILVVIDPHLDNNPVLNRAKEISSIINAQIHLLICRDHKKYVSLLADLTRSTQEEGFTVDSEIAWHGSLHKTIVTVQKKLDSRLTIKSHVADKAIKKVLLTPEDWKLLRSTQDPILFVNQKQSWDGRPVLAAVDLGNTDKRHVVLHNLLMKFANTLTKVENSPLHLVSVYPSPIFTKVHPNSHPGMSAEICEIYQTACDKYKEKYGIADENIHLCAGAPSFVIPQIAKEVKAAVCVIGTVARTGISGVLVGNTAETLLDHLSCDILVVKPDTVSDELEALMQKKLQKEQQGNA